MGPHAHPWACALVLLDELIGQHPSRQECELKASLGWQITVLRLAFVHQSRSQPMRLHRIRFGAAFLTLLLSSPAPAQDVEPRRWTHPPVGMNVLGAGVLYTDGDIAFDPPLELKDATVEVKTVLVSYLRAFDLAGMSARFDVRVPYQDSRWEGLLEGEPASTERHGLAGPRVRLSVNFTGYLFM
jgi:hypothetical protein